MRKVGRYYRQGEIDNLASFVMISPTIYTNPLQLLLNRSGKHASARARALSRERGGLKDSWSRCRIQSIAGLTTQILTEKARHN